MPNMRIAAFDQHSYALHLNPTPGANGVSGGFTQATGLRNDPNIANYRAGSSPIGHPIRLGPGSKANDVTLKRGVVSAGDLWNWIAAARTRPAAARSDVTITLRNESGQPVQSWRLAKALPMHFTGPTLGGKGTGDVAIESLTISAENIAIVPPR